MSLPGLYDVIVPFLLLLGVLIFIHELGHFAVAKWLGVKVEKFSIGFGPSLFSRKVGETEYVIAALPLGGFVKMLGEIPGEELPPEDLPRAWTSRPVWQRIAISLAGPVMNLVLPVFLIAGILMTGVPTVTSRVGGVEPGSLAEGAGLVEGDRVVGVAGTPIWRWDELAAALDAPGDATVALDVERDGATRRVELVRERAEDGAWAETGLSWHAPEALVGVIDANGAASQAGVLTGDRVTRLDGKPVANLHALERALAQVRPPFELELVRPLDGASETARVTVRELAGTPSLEALGLAGVGVRIGAVDPGSPAKAADLEADDVVVASGPDLITSMQSLQDKIRRSEGKPVPLDVLRGDTRVALEVTPSMRPIQTEKGTETHYGIGVRLGPVDSGAELKDDVVSNPFVALGRGAEKTAEMVAAIAGGIAQLVTGSVGINSLSGPIGIGEIAADAYKSSWNQFVLLMAAISVNLALLNLLPIPVLDGGQIVLAAAEGIKGSPLPARARDIAQTVGLSLILLLMGVAFWNDIARHWSGMVQFLSTLG